MKKNTNTGLNPKYYPNGKPDEMPTAYEMATRLATPTHLLKRLQRLLHRGNK